MTIWDRIKKAILWRINFIVLLVSNRTNFHKKTGSKKILIVRLDAIGDYIIFRNFLQQIRESEKFKNNEITLIGNVVWKTIAENFDNEYVDQFIWVNPNELNFNIKEVYKLLLTISQKEFSVAINPIFSRTLLSDAIIRAANAKTTYAPSGDSSNVKKIYKLINDKSYTDIIPINSETVFEFDRNLFFFERMLGKKIELQKPFLLEHPKTITLNKYIVLFPGAGVISRCWPKERYKEIINRIISLYGIPVVICGGNSEKAISDYLVEGSDLYFLRNNVGETSLTDIIDIIGGASLVISNESSAYHIAIALNVPVVCILGGGHFGRFAPYPLDITYQKVLYNSMPCFDCNWRCKYTLSEAQTYPCIEKVTTDMVWNAVQDVIDSMGKS